MLKQELSQAQKQTLSPLMRQSLTILQMDAMQLEQYLQEVALENPVIEIELPDEDLFGRSVGSVRKNADSELEPVLYVKKRVSIRDYLHEQLAMMSLSGRSKALVEYMIDNVDDSGYIEVDDEDIAKKLELPKVYITEARKLIQNMEPVGVGARSLGECLELQAKRLYPDDTLLIKMLQKSLQELAHMNTRKLARLLGASESDTELSCKHLAELNPRPGNGFDEDLDVPYIVPDVFVTMSKEGKLKVVLNEAIIPKITPCANYRSLLESNTLDETTREYLRGKFLQAENLTNCIKQRFSTLKKCAEVIVRRQTEYFITGRDELSALLLSDIAQELNMHVSTVSRAISGKYVSSRWGVRSLSDFLSRPVANGAGVTKETICSRIREIVVSEGGSALSDAGIQKALLGLGIEVSRRTVTKYRGEMGIPPANLRSS